MHAVSALNVAIGRRWSGFVSPQRKISRRWRSWPKATRTAGWAFKLILPRHGSGGFAPDMPPSERVAVRVLVSGRVQGVGFRDFTLRKAQQLRLAGWVRNLPSGEVEAYAEGARED